MSCADNESFALQVIDDSMEPEFTKGTVIIVEPGAQLETGNFVVAQCNGEYLLRQLTIRDSAWEITALNAGYESITLSGPNNIRGRVIQKSGRRRRDHKWYI